ncbi:MAG: exodeoxyribonuclease VII small subunit [Planctomycetota bacterium]
MEPSIDFETALAGIEEAVQELESGELTLDQSLKTYEKAVVDMRRCYALLDVAERKINVLSGVDAEGNPVVEPLEMADEDADLVQKQSSRSRRRTAAKEATS